MCKTRGFLKGLLAIGVAATLCGYVLAAERSTQKDQDKTTQQTQSTTQPQRQSTAQADTDMQMSGTLVRTSKLIGKPVKNTQNEDLGSIYDLVLTSDDQQVSYAALSSGGTWGMGAKYYAIPWSAIQVGSRGDITTSVSKSQLDQMGAFDKNDWPAEANPQLTSFTGQGAMSGTSSQMGTQRQSTDRSTSATDRSSSQTGATGTQSRTSSQTGAGTQSGMSSQTGAGSQTSASSQRQTTDTTADRQAATDTTRDRMSRAGMRSEMKAANRQVHYRRVSNLTGTTVRNAQGEDIGNIEDFVIDAPQGQVAYTVVSFGGLWGIGEKLAAVPASAVDIQPRRHVARLDADRKTLEQIAFKSNEFPDLSNREYAQRLHQMFNVEPYSTVLGYVGSDREQAASQKSWGPDSQFAKTFDAKNVTTIQGTVQSVGSFQPEGAAPGTAGGLRIRITTDDGNLVTVYAGPQWYAQQNDFYIKPGDKISVTGSQSKIGWRPVMVASQIKAENKTLMLRDDTGKPMWQSQAAGQQTDQGQQGTTQTQRPGQSAGGTSGTSGTGATSGAAGSTGGAAGQQPDRQ